MAGDDDSLGFDFSNPVDIRRKLLGPVADVYDIVDALKAAVEPHLSVLNSMKAIVEPPIISYLNSMKAAIEPSLGVLDSMKAVVEPHLGFLDALKAAVEPPLSVLDSMKAVVETRLSFLDAIKAAVEPHLSFLNSFNYLKESSSLNNAFLSAKNLFRWERWDQPDPKDSDELLTCLLALEHLHQNDTNRLKAFTRDTLQLPAVLWHVVARVLFLYEPYWSTASAPFSYIKKLVYRLRSKEESCQKEIIALPQKWDIQTKGPRPAYLYTSLEPFSDSEENQPKSLLVDPYGDEGSSLAFMESLQQLQKFATKKNISNELWQFLLLRLDGKTLEEAAVRLQLSPRQVEALRKKLERLIKEYQEYLKRA